MTSAAPDFSVLPRWTRGMAALAATSVDRPIRTGPRRTSQTVRPTPQQ